jgi:hypothetical protein
MFIAFNSTANSAGKALKDTGFDNLGFYTLAVLYLSFGVFSLVAPVMLMAMKFAKRGIILASIGYAVWQLSLAMCTILLRNEVLGKDGIYIFNLSVAFICGPGCSLLWISQGKYLSDAT